MNKNNKRLAVAFTGPSNSGKTTLIEKISLKLKQEGCKVAIIKHDPQDKAVFDKEGKDSYRFSKTGADVAIVSSKRTTIFKQQSSQINEIVKVFDTFDFLLVEGLKTIPLPRICIQRGKIDSDYFEISDSLAVDKEIDKNYLPRDMDILNINNIEEIIRWIKNNAQEV